MKDKIIIIIMALAVTISLDAISPTHAIADGKTSTGEKTQTSDKTSTGGKTSTGETK